MQLDRFEDVMFGIFVTDARLIGKLLLSPALAHPTIRMRLELQGTRIFDNSTEHWTQPNGVFILRVSVHGSIFVLHAVHVSLHLQSSIHASRADRERNAWLNETFSIYLAIITREMDAQDLLVFF